MSSIPLWGDVVVLCGSLLLSLVLTPFALSAAVKFGILDHPGPTKSQSRAIPYLGGAAIVVAFAATVLLATALRPPPTGLPELVAFIGLGVGLAVMGLVDDVRRGISPLLRVLLEVGAASIIWALGDSTHLAGVPSAGNAVLTVVWIVGVTNAFNLLDNMDGLSSGIATLSSLTVFGIATLQHRYLVAALSIALAGCAAGFLRHNFHPAKIYMGDAGSLFLGFVLSVLLLKLRSNAPTRVDVAVILAVAGVPLFDTALVVLSRLANRRSPFLGGRDHTSHRLVRSGLSVRRAVGAIYTAGVLFDAAALAMSEVGRDARIVGVIGIVVVLVVAGVLLWRIPVYDEPASARSLPDACTDPMALRELEASSPSGSDAGRSARGAPLSSGSDARSQRLL